MSVRLTRERRVRKVVEIIGPTARTRKVKTAVDSLKVLVDAHNINRERKSGPQKQFAEQLSTSLRRTMALLNKASDAFRPPPGFAVSASGIAISNEVFDHQHLMRHLRLLNAIAESFSKPDKPKRSTLAKRSAARIALSLCESHDIKPTRTRTGKFCQIAAAIYGDPRANLQYHCRWVLEEREAAEREAAERGNRVRLHRP